MKDRTIFLFSIGSLAYLGFLYMNSKYFKIDAIGVGVIQELLTIPVIVAQFVLLIVAMMKAWRRDYTVKSYIYWAPSLSCWCPTATVF